MTTVKEKCLTIRSSNDTILGRVLVYLYSQLGINGRNFAIHILQTRCLPFVLDKTEPNYQAIALQCAIECESWGRLIREYAGLPLPLSATTVGNPIYPVNALNSVNLGASCAVTTEELEVEQLDDDDDDDDEMDEAFARSKAHHAALFGHL